MTDGQATGIVIMLVMINWVAWSIRERLDTMIGLLRRQVPREIGPAEAAMMAYKAPGLAGVVKAGELPR